MKKTFFFLLSIAWLTACNHAVDLDDFGKTSPLMGEVTVTNITPNSATFSSSVLSYGDYSIIERGFSYGTEPKPYETGYAVAADNSFEVTISDLEPGTKYYVTPYVKVGDSKYFVGKKQEISFTTLSLGDYSSANVSSDNYQVEIALRSCYRTGARVTIEALILNKGINPYTNYRMYYIGNGYTLGGTTYHTHVEDDLYTDYPYKNLGFYLNSESSVGNTLSTQLPIGSTKVLKLTVDGVPTAAKQISVYVATCFMDASPKEYAFLTFENVPIY